MNATDTYEQSGSQLAERCRTLEAENATLRWHLAEVRRIMERIPDNGLPRSTRLKSWGRHTILEIFTRTLPRMMVVWGGAGFVAYIVALYHWQP